MKNVTIIFALALSIFSISCDDETITPSEVITYRGTQSPGDVWTWELDKVNKTVIINWDAGTFNDTSDDVLINGFYEELSSGFLKATINSTIPVSSEIPTDGSAFFYALEIENTALMVKPEGSIKGDIIAMVSDGDCSDLEGTFNYIITAPGNGITFDPIVEEAFGDATFTNNGNGFSISGNKMSLDCLNSGPCSEGGVINGIPTAVCSGNGRIEIVEAGSITAQGQFANSGVMMLDFGFGNGGVFGLKQNNIVSSTTFNNKDFNGIAYLPNNLTDKTVPVKVIFNGSGVGQAFLYTDLEANLVDNDESVKLLVESVSNGLVTGKIAHTSSTTDFAAAALISNGKEIVVLTSASDEAGNPPFLLVLTRK